MPRNYETVTTAAALETWVAQLKSANVMSLNIATTSSGYMQADIVGIAFSVEPGTVAYVPVSHDYPGAPEQLSRDAVFKALKPVLEAEQPLKVGHDLKYKAHVLKRAGIELRGDKFDTMLESYVLNSTATKHELGPISRRYLGVDPIAYESVGGKGAKQIEFNQVSLDVATNYVAEEADLALQLHRLLWPRLEALPPLKELYENIEQPLLPVLLKDGTGGRAARWRSASQTKQRAGHRHARDRSAGVSRPRARQFSLESPKQLQEVLFGKLGLPVVRKTPTGQPSTAEDVLEELAGELRAAEAHHGLPRVREVEVHVHGQAAAADQSFDSARAHLLSAGDRRDRSIVLGRSESAEHSDPHAGRPPRSPGVRGAEGHGAWSRPIIPRSNCASWRTCRATKAC